MQERVMVFKGVPLYFFLYHISLQPLTAFYK